MAALLDVDITRATVARNLSAVASISLSAGWALRNIIRTLSTSRIFETTRIATPHPHRITCHRVPSAAVFYSNAIARAIAPPTRSAAASMSLSARWA